MTATAERTTPRASRLAGYLFALAAGAIWGTTGPLSTALYRAGEAILLYIAPVLVAILAKPLLGEKLTALRIVLALVVMAGAALTVQGGSHGAGATAIPLPSLIQGVAGGLLAMVSFAGTTLLARYAVPRYGATQVLFLEILGGIVVLGIVLPPAGHTPLPPHTMGAWMYVLLLSLGSVLAANFFFFAAVRRIDAALTS